MGTTQPRRGTTATLEALEGVAPGIAVQAQTSEDGCDVDWESRLAMPLQATGGVDQTEVAREGEAGDQTHAARRELATVVDRRQPKPLFLSGVVGPGRQIVAERERRPLTLRMLKSFAERGVSGILGCGGGAGGERIEVDVGGDSQQRLVVEHGDAAEPSLPEGPGAAVLAVGLPSQGFLEALHEPAEVPQPVTGANHPGRIGGHELDPWFGDGQGASREVAEREQGQPATRDLLVRPPTGAFRIEPQEQVEVVVHDGEAAAVDREEFEEFPQSGDDPILTMGAAVAAEPGAPHAA